MGNSHPLTSESRRVTRHIPLYSHVNRINQFARGLGSSWLATFATVIYSMLSVPIALSYLSVEEFGLFVLLIQVAAYFTLIEIGISSAAARILVDYKDSPNDGRYGSVILTGFCVLALQGIFIIAIGVVAAPQIITAIGVPADFAEIATFLLRWLAVSSSLSLTFRMYGAVLYANKRLDLIHAITGGNMLFGLAVLSAILASGAGLRGLVWLFIAQTAVAILLPALACIKLELLPKAGRWGRPTLERFREIFGFGKDIFLVNVGNQVLEASQLIIVTRTMGLTAAATWSVSTKLFGLVYQLVAKIEGTAIVFFAEMMVRGETGKLASRFRQIYQLTGGLAALALAGVVTVNHSFIQVWAEPSLAWPVSLNVLMATFVFLNLLTRCSGDFIVHTKRIAAFRYIYFCEAAAFVALALLLSRIVGFYGILAASLLCLLLFRTTYTTWRMAHYFNIPVDVFWWAWLKRPITALLLLAPFVLSSGWLTSLVSGALLQLVVATVWIALPSGMILLFVVLPRDVKDELLIRLRQLSSMAQH